MRETKAKTVKLIAAQVFSVGDYVRVSEDLSVGILSYGGYGFIVDINQLEYHASVKYGDQDGRTIERNVKYARITKVPYATLVPKPRSLPTQQTSKAINTPKSLLPKEPLLKALRHGYDKRRPKGWRARDLGFDNPSKCRSEAFQRVIADDSRVLDSFLAGIEAAGRKMPNHYNEKKG